MQKSRIGHSISFILTGLFGLAAGGAFAANWYVDDAKGNDTTGDGSQAKPYKTIQAAVDAQTTQADDTIYVAPGTYDDGTTEGFVSGEYVLKSRVVLTKRINLVSTGTRDNTFIVGSYAGLENPKDSPDAVQCVYIAPEAEGSVIRGFTLRDGVLRNNINQGGGAVKFSSNTDGITPGKGFTLVLCRVDHCCAYSGGGISGGWAIATLFTRNWCFGYRGGAVYKSSCYNCVFMDNSAEAGSVTGVDAAALSNPGYAINCTCVNNYRTFSLQQNSPTETCGRFFNCVAALDRSSNTDSSLWIDNCVIEGAFGTAKSTNSKTVTESEFNSLFMAPVLDDFRPIKDGLLDGTGSRDALAFVPEEYRNLTYDGGTWNPTSDDVPIGVVLPAATPTATPMYLKSEMTVNGHTLVRSTKRMYINSTFYPRSVYVTRALTDDFAAFTVTQGAQTSYFYPDAAGGLWLTLNGPVYTNGVRIAQDTVSTQNASSGAIYYVNEKTGKDDDEAYDGKSAEKPFATLAKVAAQMTDNVSTWYVVHVAAGVYSNGWGQLDTTVDTKGASGHKVRFAIPRKCHTRLVADEGPEVTFIQGAADPDAAAANLGCGPNAIGGVDSYNNSNVGICGFTFLGCHTTADTKSGTGAAISMGGANQHVYDCVFSNNVAYGNGAAVYSAHVTRCRFQNNRSVTDNGIVASGHYAACIFEGLPSGQTLAAGGNFYNCTFTSVGMPASQGLFANDYNLYNCLVYGSGIVGGKSPSTIYGTLVHGVTVSLKTEGTTEANPYLSAPWRGDVHPLAGTAAQTAGIFDSSIVNYARYATCDYGNQPLFPTGEERWVGAETTTRRAFRTHYVSMEEGSDTNDGLTKNMAKATIKAALESPSLMTGDTVEVAPGTYDTGTMDLPSKIYSTAAASMPTVPNRVAVPMGVTLFATEGPEATAIVGAENVRCAFVEQDATLSGFTLRDATLTAAFDNYLDDCRAAGVLGRNYGLSTVVNCLITNNVCAEAPILFTSLDRCRIMGNDANGTGCETVRSCDLYNCLVDGNRGNTTIYNYHEVINVTVGRNNFNTGSGATQSYAIRNAADSTARIVNTLVLQKMTGNSQNTPSVSYSIFASPMHFSNDTTDFVNVVTNADRETVLEELDGYRPKTSTATPVGKGTDDPKMGAVDLAGAPRKMNGAVDVGCYAYDWRVDYLNALRNPRNLAISDVSANVTLSASGDLTVAAGESVTFVWKEGSDASSGYRVTADVSEGGSLGIYVNGTRIGGLTASGSYVFDAPGGDFTLRLVAEAGTVTPQSLRRNTGCILLLY